MLRFTILTMAVVHDKQHCTKVSDFSIHEHQAYALTACLYMFTVVQILLVPSLYSKQSSD